VFFSKIKIKIGCTNTRKYESIKRKIVKRYANNRYKNPFIIEIDEKKLYLTSL